jgi:type IV secretory pathway VirB10-like protein
MADMAANTAVRMTPSTFNVPPYPLGSKRTTTDATFERNVKPDLALRQVPTIADTDSTLLDSATDATVATALIGGVKMTADEWGESIVAPTKTPSPIISRTKTVKVEPGLTKTPSPPKKKAPSPPKETLPEVMGWALAELTEEEEVEQQRFSKEIRARLDAETEAAIVADNNEKMVQEIKDALACVYAEQEAREGQEDNKENEENDEENKEPEAAIVADAEEKEIKAAM